MRDKTHRKYRQSDELYALLGRLAADLGTNRTTVIELATVDLASRLDDDRESLRGRARVIDERRAVAGSVASLESRIRQGMARRRTPVRS